LCGSCGADKTRVFLRLIPEMSDRFLEERVYIQFCAKSGKLSQEMKHGAFNMIAKANDRMCYGNSRHSHDP